MCVRACVRACACAYVRVRVCVCVCHLYQLAVHVTDHGDMWVVSDVVRKASDSKTLMSHGCVHASNGVHPSPLSKQSCVRPSVSEDNG